MSIIDGLHLCRRFLLKDSFIRSKMIEKKASVDSLIDYHTTSTFAEKLNISSRRVVMLCVAGRLSGAVKMDNTWLIPKDAEKPGDGRRKKGE